MFYTLFSLYSMHCDKIVEVKMNPTSCFWSGCWSLLGPRAADLRQNYFDPDRGGNSQLLGYYVLLGSFFV